MDTRLNASFLHNPSMCSAWPYLTLFPEDEGVKLGNLTIFELVVPSSVQLRTAPGSALVGISSSSARAEAVT